MIERNKKLKLGHSATLICNEKKKTMFKGKELEHFEQSIELLEEGKRYEAQIVLEYIMHGNKIIVKDSREIQLFPNIDGGRVEPSWIIRNNEELYKFLKELISLKSS